MLANVHTLLYSQVEWPFPAHLDLYQIVRPSSRRRKCRCLFHIRDLTFLRVDPVIITLIWGSSWVTAQSHVKGERSWLCHTSDTSEECSSKKLQKYHNWSFSQANNIYSREPSESIASLESCQWKGAAKKKQMSANYIYFVIHKLLNTNNNSIK